MEVLIMSTEKELSIRQAIKEIMHIGLPAIIGTVSAFMV